MTKKKALIKEDMNEEGWVAKKTGAVVPIPA
jgi:hypothetical protein